MNLEIESLDTVKSNPSFFNISWMPGGPGFNDMYEIEYGGKTERTTSTSDLIFMDLGRDSLTVAVTAINRCGMRSPNSSITATFNSLTTTGEITEIDYKYVWRMSCMDYV